MTPTMERTGSGINWKNLALLTLGVAGTLFWIAQAPASDDAVFPMPSGRLYAAECGGCHTAYAPGFLPARSWRRMMNELADHFGEDVSLPEPERLAILKDLELLAADNPQASQRMRRIAASIPANAAPQRISETGFFRFMHDEVPNHFWRRKKIGSKANCGACHIRADQGRYGEREVRIPPAD